VLHVASGVQAADRFTPVSLPVLGDFVPEPAATDLCVVVLAAGKCCCAEGRDGSVAASVLAGLVSKSLQLPYETISVQVLQHSPRAPSNLPQVGCSTFQKLLHPVYACAHTDDPAHGDRCTGPA